MHGHVPTRALACNARGRLVIAELRMASGTPEYVEREGALFTVLNGGPQVTVTLPDVPKGQVWTRRFDTAQEAVLGAWGGTTVEEDSVVVFVLEEAATRL